MSEELEQYQVRSFERVSASERRAHRSQAARAMACAAALGEALASAEALGWPHLVTAVKVARNELLRSAAAEWELELAHDE